LVVPGSFRGFDHAVLAAELAASVETLEHAFVLEPKPQDPPGLISFAAFMAEPWETHFGDAVDAVQVDPDAPRTILFTSGTESRPKGVIHSYNTLFFGLKKHVPLFGFGPKDVVLTASPVGHGTGAVNGAEFALLIGGRVVL